ncbi:asparaginyl-tRNA synthetase [Fennellomyces sp. T-0311]|nr:asparaginyl-tRNA synthetase [Fennellomyces sp. T-0311]
MSLSALSRRLYSTKPLLPSTVRSLTKALPGAQVTVQAWVRSVRKQKQICFANVNDGTSLKGLQAILTGEQAETLTTGTCVQLQGTMVESPGQKQGNELQVNHVQVIGECDGTFPLQKKRHTLEFLRTINHLRARGNTGGAVLRVRNAAGEGLQRFFAEHEFTQVHTPIMTSNDCEGGGEVFKVTPASSEKTDDFFNKPVFLTVSGQLHAEMLASALSRVYTFGPVFRAEESVTSRHLAEFWMLEAEMCFINQSQLLDVTEASIQSTIRHVLDTCDDEMRFFDTMFNKTTESKLKRLEQSAEQRFRRITYTEAIEELQRSKQKFKFPTTWGSSLQSEHERYLARDGPVFVTDYPADQKPFYMRANDDGRTVGCFDLLLPDIGELVGGSMREERYDVLEHNMTAAGMNVQDYQWYLDLRKYGSAPHGGYGIGFERLLLWLTGLENVREVVPVPRWVGHCKY